MKYLRTKRFIAIILFFVFSVVTVVLVMKWKKKSNPEKTEMVQNDSYDFLIFNTEPKFQDCLQKIAEEYRNISGIVPAVVAKDSEILYNFNSDLSPDIFMLKTFDEMKVQLQYGNILDFLNASEKTFQEVIKNIPDVLQAKVSNINSCGIPVTIRGFGLAVNQKLLASIFGEDSYKNLVNDLIICSYEEFDKFVNDLKSSHSVKLNNTEYKISQKPPENIFSFHVETPIATLLNAIFSSFFEDASDLALSDSISKMTGKFSDWLKAIDLITSNTSLKRGRDFVNLEQNSRSKAIKEFSEGKSLFLIADDTDYEEIKNCNPEVASHLTFIPFKVPRTSDENKDLNTNLTVYVPYCFMINAKSSKSKMAQDFLTWFVSSPVARKYLLEDAGCVSYDVREVDSIENTLLRSAVNYLQSGNSLAPVFQGIKKSWLNSISQQLMRKYFPSNSWSVSHYNNFDSFCIKKWSQ